MLHVHYQLRFTPLISRITLLFARNDGKTLVEPAAAPYFIQNLSPHDHSFTVDHIVRKEWKRLGADGKDQIGPDVYRFKVEVKSKQTAKQEVVEERVHTDRGNVVGNLSGAELRSFITHAAPSAAVKQALQQTLDKQISLRQLQQDITEKKAVLKLLTEDQARVRDNLQVIPQSSDHYKHFLTKFVAQETQIEESQQAIRTQEAQFQKMQKELEAFVTGLTVQ